MKVNWLICILLIMGSGIFATFYGGNVSYALFYLMFFLPVVAFFYTVYVYFRFKLYQSIDNRVVVKGDWTLYSFIVANEDYITFRNVKVNFLSDKSTIESTKQSTEYSLIPNDSERLETRIRCNYRGEYYVGIDSVEVTDFLYLFKIKYPILTKLKAVVLPRVVQLERLGIAPSLMDVKNPQQYSNSTEEELDTEIRKYILGDSRKRIHWKASAKHRELLSRKYHQKPKADILLFMDLTRIKEDDISVVITEDKIIESILAIANYYSLRRIPSQIIYDMEGYKEANIRSKVDFTVFYRACVSIKFNAKIPINDLMKEKLLTAKEGEFFVMVTHSMTKELYMSAIQGISYGNTLCILYISDDVGDNTKDIISSLRLAGVSVFQILSEDEISDVLSREIIA